MTGSDDYATVSFGTDSSIEDPSTTPSIINGETIRVTSLVATGGNSVLPLLGIIGGVVSSLILFLIL